VKNLAHYIEVNAVPHKLRQSIAISCHVDWIFVLAQ